MRRGFRALTLGALIASLVPVARAEKNSVRQDGTDTDDQEFKAEAPDRPEDMPLALLPSPPSVQRKAPRPQALEAIDQLLDRLVATDPLLRERAARSLLEAKSDWIGGLSRRIDRIAEKADRSAMKRLLKDSRDRTRARLKEEIGGKVETPDYLEILHEHAQPNEQVWRDLTQLLGTSRMLTAIGSTAAVREIIRIHVRFGEFVRIDCQKQLEQLEDRSIAALIETRRHQAPKIAKWAEKRLDLRKKLNPQDAVRTDDPQALADTLVALGSLRDPESTQLLISFAGTEQSQIRNAARQGIALLGDVAAWQLRDAYLNTTGKRPPRDWTWKRTARELFTEFDRLRLEEIYGIFSSAKKARDAGDLAAMGVGFDQVLLLNPEFSQRAEMAEGYLKLADQLRSEKPKEALFMLERVTRISDSAALTNQALARRKLIEAQALRSQGIVDQKLVSDVKKLSPSLSSEASDVLNIGPLTNSWTRSSRYLVAGITTLLALAGAAWILLTAFLRRREVSTSAEPAGPPTGPKLTKSAAEDTGKSDENHSTPAESAASIETPTDEELLSSAGPTSEESTRAAPFPGEQDENSSQAPPNENDESAHEEDEETSKEGADASTERPQES